MFSRVTGLGFVLMSLSVSVLASGETAAEQKVPAGNTIEPVAADGPVTTGAANALRIYLDPKTGEITEPPADVAAQMSAEAQLQVSPADEEPLETFALPGGGISIVVGDRFNKPVNIRVGCDGKTIEQGHDVDVSKAKDIDCN
jgi:hypothetical protein